MEPELVYERFVLRLDGPVLEVMGAEIKGIFRLHVNFAQASLTAKKNGMLEIYVDDGGALDRPLLQSEISGIWRVWRYEVPATEEAALTEFFSEAEQRRSAPR
ncbi:MAG: hypothetical protein JST31_14380 [Actinobacteria bacterium]|nr:hypothetical protein [Actinomycetota bacterium]